MRTGATVRPFQISGAGKGLTYKRHVTIKSSFLPRFVLGYESSGAVARPLNMYLKGLAKQSKSPDGCDSTAYGQGRASPSSFYAHHLASLSCSIVFADALALRNRAASDAFYL